MLPLPLRNYNKHMEFIFDLFSTGNRCGVRFLPQDRLCQSCWNIGLRFTTVAVGSLVAVCWALILETCYPVSFETLFSHGRSSSCQRNPWQTAVGSSWPTSTGKAPWKAPKRPAKLGGARMITSHGLCWVGNFHVPFISHRNRRNSNNDSDDIVTSKMTIIRKSSDI